MNRIAHRSAFLVAVMLAMNTIGGCANQNIDAPSRVAQLESVYNTTLGVLIDFRRAGKIEDNLYNEIEQYRGLANSALDNAKVAAVNNDATALSIALKSAQGALDEMVRRRYLVEKRAN